MFVEGSHSQTVTLQRITLPREQQPGLAGCPRALSMLKAGPCRASKCTEQASAQQPPQSEVSTAGASKHPGSPDCYHISDTRAKRGMGHLVMQCCNMIMQAQYLRCAGTFRVSANIAREASSHLFSCHLASSSSLAR